MPAAAFAPFPSTVRVSINRKVYKGIIEIKRFVNPYSALSHSKTLRSDCITKTIATEINNCYIYGNIYSHDNVSYNQRKQESLNLKNITK